MYKKLSLWIVILVSLGILSGCKTEEKKVEQDVSIINEYKEKLKDKETELDRVNSILEMTKEALKERDESIERLNNRIKELEAFVEFPEPDPNKKNYTGIGESEFLPIPRQDKTSKGDSDFD